MDHCYYGRVQRVKGMYTEFFIVCLAYRTDEGKPWVLPLVRRLEQQMACDPALNKEYLPVLGLESFTTAATSMLLGFDSPAIYEGRVSDQIESIRTGL